MQASTDDLKREYRRANLWRLGLTMQKAIADPLIRKGLELGAKAHSKPQQPYQPRLF